MSVLLGLLLNTSPTWAGDLTLTVEARGFTGTEGQALFALYDSEGAWLDAKQAVQTADSTISGDTVTAVFRGLDPGQYGVAVLHDANKNFALDMRWFPIPGPAEGSGVSNDAPANFGPPSYADAALALGADTRIVVTMRY